MSRICNCTRHLISSVVIFRILFNVFVGCHRRRWRFVCWHNQDHISICGTFKRHPTQIKMRKVFTKYFVLDTNRLAQIKFEIASLYRLCFCWQIVIDFLPILTMCTNWMNKKVTETYLKLNALSEFKKPARNVNVIHHEQRNSGKKY